MPEGNQPKLVPRKVMSEARKAFEIYITAHGFTHVVKQLITCLETEHAKSTKQKHLKNSNV